MREGKLVASRKEVRVSIVSGEGYPGSLILFIFYGLKVDYDIPKKIFECWLQLQCKSDRRQSAELIRTERKSYLLDRRDFPRHQSEACLAPPWRGHSFFFHSLTRYGMSLNVIHYPKSVVRRLTKVYIELGRLSPIC